MTVGVIGTTIAPWMQFYLQSSIVEKGVGVRQYKASRLDVIVGSIFTDIVAWFIVVACAATLFTHGMRDISVPSDAAEAMSRWPDATPSCSSPPASSTPRSSPRPSFRSPPPTPSAKASASRAASTRASAKPPSSTGSTPCSSCSAPRVVLIPSFPLVKVTILSQVLNGALLPVVLIFMLRLINKHELMGEYTNSLWFNIVAWTTSIVMILLSAVYAAGLVRDMLHHT